MFCMHLLIEYRIYKLLQKFLKKFYCKLFIYKYFITGAALDHKNLHHLLHLQHEKLIFVCIGFESRLLAYMGWGKILGADQ